VEGTDTRRRWFQRATVYFVSMTLAGTALGAVVALGGTGLYALAPGVQRPLAVGLGALTCAYALHELAWLRLPVPGRDWQVPASWVRHGFYRSAAIFGSIVGFGVLTRVPYASMPILLGWLLVSGNVILGIATGMLYGVVRAVSIYSSAGVSEVGGLVKLNERLTALTPSIHELTGVALAAFAGYLVLGPFL
jgi:hypothetical protein